MGFVISIQIYCFIKKLDHSFIFLCGFCHTKHLKCHQNDFLWPNQEEFYKRIKIKKTPFLSFALKSTSLLRMKNKTALIRLFCTA